MNFIKVYRSTFWFMKEPTVHVKCQFSLYSLTIVNFLYSYSMFSVEHRVFFILVLQVVL